MPGITYNQTSDHWLRKISLFINHLSLSLDCLLDRLRYMPVYRVKHFPFLIKGASGITEHNSYCLPSKYCVRFLVVWKKPETALNYSPRSSHLFIHSLDNKKEITLI